MSSGKVKCTCGWSWNKSDSSKKDMYICHECGRDNSNNMKNGGWLDNYNDSQASAPEGMEGDGFSNVGRNYSPAWGGQFQEGGEIPKAQDGRATRADSLALYNNSKEVENFYKKNKYKKEPSEDSQEVHKYNDILYRQYNPVFTTRVDAGFFESDNVPKNEYRKVINKNKYYQRENANNQLNTNAQMQLYDRRIEPRVELNYSRNNDFVEIPTYNNIANKPFDLLTDSEKKLRVEKYGTSGVPKSYLNKNKNPQQQVIVKPTTTKQTIKPNSFTDYNGKGGNWKDAEGYVWDDRYPESDNYKKKPIQQRDKINSLQNNLNPAGLVQGDTELNADVSGLRPEARRAKYFNVQDTVYNKMGEGITNYRWNPSMEPMQELAPEPYNTRKITPQYQMGGNVYPVNYVPQAQDGISEDAMRGMMKSKIGMGNAFGHPAIKRMSQAFPKTGMTPEGMGTHYMSSVDNYAVPLLQDFGEEELRLVDPSSRSKEAIKFNSPKEAQYFAEHYKDVAPMSNAYKGLQEYAMGGSIPGAVGFSYARTQGAAPSNGKYAKKTLPSAQNGQEMQYYREGLDFQPKTISRDGSELQNIEQAQFGKTLTPKQLELKKQVQRNNRKIETQNKYNEYQENKRKDAYLENKKAQAKSYVQANMEEAYKSPLMSPGYFTPEGVAIGALQGATKMGPDLYEGNYKGAAMDALMMLPLAPSAIKTATPLIQKAGRALGTEEGLLSNAYKHNPWAFKPNESNWYRQVGKSAVDDVLDTGLVREAGEEVSPRMWEEFQDQIKRLQGDDALPHFEKMKQQMLAGRRPVAPFFNKGELFYPMNRKPVINKTTGKLSKNPAGAGSADYLIETTLPNESFQPAYVKGMSLGVPKEIGSTAILKPNPELRNLENFNLYKKNWLQGYKEVPKKEDGGIIKDDRGQWDHPGEITEIGSNDITMEGVPYDVLGISDTGDTKLMKPGKNYKFKGKKVTEFPMAQNGLRQEQKGLQNLDNLTNFTNYNKPQPGGWLSKYE